MRKGFQITEKYLQEQKLAGKIRDFKVQVLKKEVKFEDPNGRIVSKVYGKRTSREKEWVEQNLLYWANGKGFKLMEEYKFWPERKFKSDWYIPALNLLVEYEGGVFMEKSGHTNAASYTKDLVKYNEAVRRGYKLLRINAMTYKSLLTELNKFL